MFGNIKQNLGKIIFFIDNCVRVVNSATSKSLVAKYTVFPHPNIHKEDWQCTHKANIVGLSRKNGFCGKTIRITYFLCVCVCVCVCVALIIRHVKSMNRVILSSVTCLTLPYF